jgi:hypothetical protein
MKKVLILTIMLFVTIFVVVILATELQHKKTDSRGDGLSRLSK